MLPCVSYREFARGLIVGLWEHGFRSGQLQICLSGIYPLLCVIRLRWFRNVAKPNYEVQDRHLRRMVTKDRLNSTRSIGDQCLSKEGRSGTTRIVYCRTRTFLSYRPHLLLSLKAQHQQQRLKWCRLRPHWNRSCIGWCLLMFLDQIRILFGVARWSYKSQTRTWSTSQCSNTCAPNYVDYGVECYNLWQKASFGIYSKQYERQVICS